MKLKKKNKIWKQYLVVFMAIMLIVSSLPLSTFAESAPPFVPSPETEPITVVPDPLPTPPPKLKPTSLANQKPDELTNERTENVKIFDNHDGTYTKKFYAAPVHVKEKGKWENISTTLSESSKTTIATKKTKLKMNFQKTMNNGSYATFEAEGHTIRTALIGAKGKSGELKPKNVNASYKDNTVWYKGIFPQIDLRSVAFNKNVKEDIVLQKYTGHHIFSFEIQTDLVPTLKDDGYIEFQDSNQHTIITIPKPFMSDSNVSPESGEVATSEEISYEIKKLKDQNYELTVNANPEWLASPERVYPVYIDPSYTIDEFFDAYVSSAYRDTNYSGNRLWDAGQEAFILKVGYYDSSTGDNYAYIKQDLSELKGATIVNAKFWLYSKHSYSTTPKGVWLSEAKWDWNPYTITWNNSPSVSNIAYTEVARNQWAEFDVTGTIQKWVNNPATNYGFSVHTSGNGQAFWKKFVASENGDYSPELTVTYSYPKPKKPRVTAYSNGIGSSSGYFDLSWDAVPGADSYDVLLFNGYDYQYVQVGNVTNWTTKGKNIWPTPQEVEEGEFKLHDDGKGAELALDPGQVYKNAYLAGSPYGDYSSAHGYWVGIVANYPLGDSPMSDVETANIPLEPVRKPTGAAYTNISGKDGYTTVNWEAVPGATGYRVWVYNGIYYEAFDAGNVTTWTTQNQNIWPTESEIAAGRYQLHHDKLGTELSLDPSPVYRNSGGIYGGATGYWFRVTAYSSAGHPESSISEEFIPKFTTTSLFGMKDFWQSIPVIGGQVTAFNGNFVMDETDFQLSGRGPDVVSNRTYNSQDTSIGLFGKGWYSSLEESIKEDGTGNILLTEADKGNILFTKTGTNQYHAPNGIFLEIKKTDTGFEIKDKDQSVTFFSLDGKKQYEKDEHGNQVTFSYDTSGKLTKITDASGRSLDLEYTRSKVTKITGPENRTVSFEYDGDYLIASTTPRGKKYRYGYEDGKLRYSYDPKHTDAKPYKTTYTYENNKLVKVTDPLGKETSLQFDDSKREVTVTDPKGNKTAYGYTISGNPNHTIVDAAGLKLTTSYEYQANNIIKKTDPKDQGLRATETYTYDGKGNVTSTTDAIGTEKYEYNKTNDVTKITDTENKTTSITYNGANPVSETNNTAKTSSLSSFDSFGNPISGSAALTTGVNMLRNPGFEDGLSDGFGVSWYSGRNNSDGGSVARDNTVRSSGFGGAYSMRLVSIPSGTGKGSVYAFQIIDVEPNKTYTISAWIKTQNVTNAGAFFNVAQMNANGEGIADGWRDNRNSQITGTNDWTEKQFTFKTTASTGKISVYLQLEQQTGSTTAGGGTVWFDKVQVEEGPVSSSINPVVNGSFERNDVTGFIPYWVQTTSNGSKPYQLSNEAFDGDYSISIERKANTDPNVVYGQRIYLNQDKVQPLTVTAMSKAENVKNVDNLKESKDHSMTAILTFQDGTSSTKRAMFPMGTHDWSRSAVLIEETKPIKYIEVFLVFENNHTGKIWFDAVRLIEGNVLTKNEYDSNGNYVTGIYDEENRKTSFTYDTYGNKKTETDPKGNTKSFDYNPDHQLTKTTLPNGTAVSYAYDDNGNTTSKTITADGKTQTVTYAYDVDNKVTEFQDALLRKIVHTYDANANLSSTAMPKGDFLEWTYDGANRIQEAKRNGTVAFTYQYDANGNETEVIDSVNGVTRDKAYDVGNRITSMTDRGGSVAWTYHDKTHKLKETKITQGTFANTTSYVYNALDQNTEVSDAGQTYRFAYDEFGNVRNYMAGNGAGSYFQYDKTNKVDQLAIGTRQGTSILQEAYKYDANGNRSSIERQTSAGKQTTTYEYDSINQLKKETLPDGTIKEYGYDGFGNRTTIKETTRYGIATKTAVFNAGNQLTTFNGEVIAYDLNGNRTSDENYTYTWNAADQLTAIARKADNSTVATYRYDDDGRRIEKTADGQTTRYYYDGDSINVLYETDASGNVLRQYVYGVNGVRLAMKTQGDILYYHYNPHGDVVAMTDQTGNVVAKYEYDAWGKVLKSETSPNASGNPFGYAGYMYDKETGLYYLMARYYHPMHGVFLSIDPDPGDEDDPITQNGYTYANNNPVMLVDPDGNKSLSYKDGEVGFELGMMVANWINRPKSVKFRSHAVKHVYNRHVRTDKNRSRSKWTVSDWKSYAKETVRKPHYVYRQSNGYYVFQRKYSYNVGIYKKKKTQWVKVVVKPNKELVTAYTIKNRSKPKD